MIIDFCGERPYGFTSSIHMVMRNGRLAGELPRAQASQSGVLKLMAGVAA